MKVVNQALPIDITLEELCHMVRKVRFGNVLTVTQFFEDSTHLDAQGLYFIE